MCKAYARSHKTKSSRLHVSTQDVSLDEKCSTPSAQMLTPHVSQKSHPTETRFRPKLVGTEPPPRHRKNVLVERRARKAVAKINELYTLPDPLHRRLEAEEEQRPLEELQFVSQEGLQMPTQNIPMNRL